MKKFIIAGGPHTGKTTLLDALKKKHPSFIYLPEAATLVIEREYEKEKNNPSYTGIFPWNNEREFFKKATKQQQALEASIPQNAEIVILDRSLIDNIAYWKANYDELYPVSIHDDIKKAQYAGIFFCEFVGTYQQNEIRQEPFELAQKIQQLLLEAYQATQIPFYKLPEIPIEERIKEIEKILGRNS